MDAQTRAAVISRFSAIAGVDEPVPQSWDEIQNLGLKLQIEGQDPELAQVLKGKMSAQLEAQVLAGKWSSDAPAPRDLAAEKEAAIQAALAGLPIQGQEALEARLKQRLADGEQQRRNSAVMATGRWGQ